MTRNSGRSAPWRFLALGLDLQVMTRATSDQLVFRPVMASVTERKKNSALQLDYIDTCNCTSYLEQGFYGGENNAHGDAVVVGADGVVRLGFVLGHLSSFNSKRPGDASSRRYHLHASPGNTKLYEGYGLHHPGSINPVFPARRSASSRIPRAQTRRGRGHDL